MSVGSLNGSCLSVKKLEVDTSITSPSSSFTLNPPLTTGVAQLIGDGTTAVWYIKPGFKANGGPDGSTFPLAPQGSLSGSPVPILASINSCVNAGGGGPVQTDIYLQSCYGYSVSGGDYLRLKLSAPLASGLWMYVAWFVVGGKLGVDYGATTAVTVDPGL